MKLRKTRPLLKCRILKLLLEGQCLLEMKWQETCKEDSTWSTRLKPLTRRSKECTMTILSDSMKSFHSLLSQSQGSTEMTDQWSQWVLIWEVQQIFHNIIKDKLLSDFKVPNQGLLQQSQMLYLIGSKDLRFRLLVKLLQLLRSHSWLKERLWSD